MFNFHKKLMLLLLIFILFFQIVSCEVENTVDLGQFNPFELVVEGQLSDNDVTVEWIRTMGYPNGTRLLSFLIDDSDNLYLAGHFYSETDFDPGPGEFFVEPVGDCDAYLCKLDSEGAFVWVRNWGGVGLDEATKIAADDHGNMYVTGRFQSAVDFDPSQDNELTREAVGSDGYLMSLDTDGNFHWVRTWPGGCGLDLALDNNRNIYVTGSWGKIDRDHILEDPDILDLDPGESMDFHSPVGLTDILVIKYSPTGDFYWAVTYGETGEDTGTTITVDEASNVYLTGIVRYWEDVWIYNHIFIASYTSTGATRWDHVLDANIYNAVAGAIKCTDILTFDGNFYITGELDSPIDFDPGSGTDVIGPDHVGSTDIFVTTYAMNGDYQWTTVRQNLGMDRNGYLGINSAGELYVFSNGQCRPNYGVDFYGLGLENYPNSDLLLSGYDSSGNREWDITWGGPGIDFATGLIITESDDIYVSGVYQKYLEEEELIDEYADLEPDQFGWCWVLDIFLMKLIIDKGDN